MNGITRDWQASIMPGDVGIVNYRGKNEAIGCIIEVHKMPAQSVDGKDKFWNIAVQRNYWKDVKHHDIGTPEYLVKMVMLDMNNVQLTYPSTVLHVYKSKIARRYFGKESAQARREWKNKYLLKLKNARALPCDICHQKIKRFQRVTYVDFWDMAKHYVAYHTKCINNAGINQNINQKNSLEERDKSE